MTGEPWIGDESTAPAGTCAYALDWDEPKCGAAATTHLLSESAIHGLVALSTCERHAPLARASGPYLGEHAYGPVCAAPVTIWEPDGCHLKETS